MVLGTNAMVEFGLQVVQADGSIVLPSSSTPTKPETTSVRRVFLTRVTHLAPGQTKQVEVTTEFTEYNDGRDHGQ